MASPKGIDPKKDKIVFAGIPDWAVDLDWEYKAAIIAFFMVVQIKEIKNITAEKTRSLLSTGFKGSDKEERIAYLMKLFQEHGILKPA